MNTYQLVIHQHVRYTVEIEAEDPQAAVEQIRSGLWDDSNNMVLDDRVQVYDGGEEELLLDTSPEGGGA